MRSVVPKSLSLISFSFLLFGLFLHSSTAQTTYTASCSGCYQCQFLHTTPNAFDLSPALSSITNCTNATVTQRSSLSALDNNNWVTSLATQVRRSDCQLFNFYVPDLQSQESAEIFYSGYNSGSSPADLLTLTGYYSPERTDQLTQSSWFGNRGTVNFTLTLDMEAYRNTSSPWVRFSACATFLETDSTPILYTWNGTAFTFVDEVGRGFMGSRTTWEEWSGNNANQNYTAQLGVYPHSYTAFPASLLQASNGKFNMKLTSEKEEISFVDVTELWAIDHANNVVIYADYLQSGVVHAVAQPETQLVNCTVRDPQASSCLSTLSSLDKVDWLQNIWTSPSTIELDFGLTSQPQYFRLIINLRWYKGVESYMVAPALGLRTRSRLIVQQWNSTVGGYVNVPSQWNPLAFPGQPTSDGVNIHFTRTSLVVNLTGLPLDSQNRKIQLVFHDNVRPVQIDRVTADLSAPATFTSTVLPVESATLGYRGVGRGVYNFTYSLLDSLNYYDFDNTTGIQPYISGMFTRYGDVTPLLRSVDDEFVVMGRGDSLTLVFNATAAPSPATGTRSFFFYNANYYKAQSRAFGRTVNPIPFASMGTYPYNPATTSYNTTRHASYLSTYNTRNITATTDHQSLYTDFISLTVTPFSPSPSPPGPTRSPSRSPSRPPSRSRSPSPSRSPSRSSSPSRSPSRSPRPGFNVGNLAARIDNLGDARTTVAQCFYLNTTLNVSTIATQLYWNGPRGQVLYYSIALHRDVNGTSSLSSLQCNSPAVPNVVKRRSDPLFPDTTSRIYNVNTGASPVTLTPGTYWLVLAKTTGVLLNEYVCCAADDVGSKASFTYSTEISGPAVLGRSAYRTNYGWATIAEGYKFMFSL